MYLFATLSFRIAFVSSTCKIGDSWSSLLLADDEEVHRVERCVRLTAEENVEIRFSPFYSMREMR